MEEAQTQTEVRGYCGDEGVTSGSSQEWHAGGLPLTRDRRLFVIAPIGKGGFQASVRSNLKTLMTEIDQPNILCRNKGVQGRINDHRSGRYS